MTPKSVPVSKIINITNRLLNKLVKKRFGNHITIRVNSLHFISNSYMDYHSFIPEINLKSSKRVSLEELNNIDIFLKNQLNIILKITENKVLKDIVKIRILVN
jgi:hypothetical protein